MVEYLYSPQEGSLTHADRADKIELLTVHSVMVTPDTPVAVAHHVYVLGFAGIGRTPVIPCLSSKPDLIFAMSDNLTASLAEPD